MVTFIDPGRCLTLRGPMGMRGAVAGVISFDLEASGTETVINLSRRVVGDVSDEDRADYSAGWSELLTDGLKAFVEAQHVGA